MSRLTADANLYLVLSTPELRHHLLAGPAGDLHAVEAGEGPMVLLLHGFPEGWASWLPQLTALAEAGYRAVAIDVRGYGQSAAPTAVEDYRMLAHVADNLAVVEGLAESQAVVIGHDWGSPIAAASAQLRPDVFRAVGLLGVPFTPRGPVKPTAMFAGAAGAGEDFYVSYFQQPGVAEAEIEQDVHAWLRGFYLALDGPTPAPGIFTIPTGSAMRDRFPLGGELPSWLNAEALTEHAAEFGRRGAAGALNRYRNMDRDWADLAAFDGVPIAQPSIYIAGSNDPSTAWLSDAIAMQATWLPGLSGTHLIDGAGHWVNQERPEDVNALLLYWLAGIAAGS